MADSRKSTAPQTRSAASPPRLPRLITVSGTAAFHPNLPAPCDLAKVPPAELHLMQRVFDRCSAAISKACSFSSVPAAFLGALTANESGGDATAVRFEPAVYAHLAAVSRGERHAYGSITEPELDSEIADLLHPKAASYHERFLDVMDSLQSAATGVTASVGQTTGGQRPPLHQPAGGQGPALQQPPGGQRPPLQQEDETLRELATSWGFTQIMGYHLIGRAAAIADLLEPDFHFHLAIELLAGFAHEFGLSLSSEFRELFACWNTGRPYGETFDPHYIENGMRRMEIYSEIEKRQEARA
jgi:hypothetical protein